MDDQLTFNQYISNMCSKAAMQLNIICRLAKVMGNEEKIAITNSFVYSNFNYCRLVSHPAHVNLRKKSKKFKNLV